MKKVLILIVMFSFSFAIAQETSNLSKLAQAEKTLNQQHKDAEFIENKGQWNSQAKYVTKSNLGNVWIFDKGIRIDAYSRIEGVENDKKEEVKGQVFDIEFVRSSFKTENIVPNDKKEGYYNYFIGDAKYHASNVMRYSSLFQKGLYNNIDAQYYINESGEFEYDFIVNPSGNPYDISYKINYAEKVSIEGDRLCVETKYLGKIYMPKPVAYQIIRGIKRVIDLKYSLNGDIISFASISGYDKTQKLIIDPTFSVSYHTYLGQNSSCTVRGMELDATGVYLTGSVNNSTPGFPTTTGAYDVVWNGGNQDAYISKFNSTCSSLIFSSFIGSSSEDVSNDVLLMDGAVIIAGFTTNVMFPHLPSPMDNSYGGAREGFITCFNTTGTALLSSSFWGGQLPDEIMDLCKGTSTTFYVSGTTNSKGTNTSDGYFPISSSGVYDNTQNGGSDMFITKFNYSNGIPTMSASTYLGGLGLDFNARMAYINDVVYVIGYTTAGSFPITPFAYDNSRNGYTDGVMSILSGSLTTLNYSTFIGGSDNEYLHDIILAERKTGQKGFNAQSSVIVAYIGGSTSSSDFPITPDAYDATYNGSNANSDGFVLEFTAEVLNVAPAGVTYSTFFGGGYSSGQLILSSVNSLILIGGTNNSTVTLGFVGQNHVNTPTTSGISLAIQTSNQGLLDGFYAQITYPNPLPSPGSVGTGISTLDYSTVLGGADKEQSMVVRRNSNGCRVVASNVASASGFPSSVSASYQASHTASTNYSANVLVLCNNGVDDPLERIQMQNSNLSSIVTSDMISIAPNPATDHLNVQIPSGLGMNKLSVLNLNGQVMMEKTLDSDATELELNVNDLPNAMYILKLEGAAQPQMTKFVKQ